jgi:hypothetical protein
VNNFALWNGKRPDDDSEQPQFGRKARQWFYQLLREKLFEKCCQEPGELDVFEIDPVIEHLLVDPLRFVKWVPFEQYQGGNYASGAWVLDPMRPLWAAVYAARCEVRGEVQRQLDAGIKSLDEWLLADAKGTLNYSGAEGGTSLLHFRLQKRLCKAAAKRRGRWPRICPKCRSEFTPGRANAIYCPTCRTVRREASSMLFKRDGASH